MDYFSSEVYDGIYKKSPEYAKTYKEFRAYPVFQQVLRYIGAPKPVLELGCGPGHLARMLFDNGFTGYTGVDFSGVAISMAREKVPAFNFHHADLMGFDYSGFTDGVIVSTACLEHVKDDRGLIRMLPKNDFVFSVPNFMCDNHYRCFKSKEGLIEYYHDVLDIKDVTEIHVVHNVAFVCKSKVL